MRNLAMPLLLAMLSVSMAVPSCATAPPIVHDVVTCGGNTVAPADVAEAFQDLKTQNWVDLAQLGVRIGWDVVACVIDDLTAAHPELKPAGEKFKSDHAEQIRKAQAPSVSLRGPTLNKGPVISETVLISGPSIPYAYAGETVDHAAKRCALSCGPGAESAGSPGQSCLCRNSARVWVSAR